MADNWLTPTLPDGGRPRGARPRGSSSTVNKVLDLVGGITQRKAAAPDFLPAAAAAITAANSTAAPSALMAVAPIAAAVAGPLMQFALNRADRGVELRAVERQQLRESSERLLAGARVQPPGDEVELCGEDEDGVASCEKVERFTDRATGRIMARRKDGKLYSDCERLPNGALSCKRGTKKLVEVRKK